MARTIVGILRGGASPEYDLSLKTGVTMRDALPDDRYDVRDIFVDKQGVWHARGIPSDPARILSQMDVVLNALHGDAGEDGTVQRILDRSGVRYAGPRAHAALASYHRPQARDILKLSGVKIPQGVSFSLDSSTDTGAMAREVFARFGPPYMVKPARGSALRGIRLARTIIELPHVLGDVLDTHGGALVEEYVRGHDASASVLEGFRGENIYTFPPVHSLVSNGFSHINTEHIENNMVRHTCPSHFAHEEKQCIADAARMAHQALGMTHFSHSDFRVAPHGIYLVKTDHIPRLYPGGVHHSMFDAVGVSTREFVEHLIMLAQKT